MALDLYRTDRIERDYTVTVLDENGTPVVITSVQVALLPYPSTGPTATTVWATKTVTGGVVTLTFAGPSATPTAGDLLPPLGQTDLYMNDVNGDFRKAKSIERVTVD